MNEQTCIDPTSVKKEEFEKFSKSLNDKMDKLDEKTSEHEKHIDNLNDLVNEIKMSFTYLEKTIDSGFKSMNERMSDISSFLNQQSDSLKDYNFKANDRRDRVIDEKLLEIEKTVAVYMNDNSEKINYTVEKIDKFNDFFESKDEQKKTFWTYVVTSIVSIIIALINIIPAIMGK